MSTHDYATVLRPELMAFDSTTNRIVHLYRNASGHPAAFIGTVASNGTISWGSSQTINSGSQLYFGVHAYNGKVLVNVGSAEYDMATRLCTIDSSDNSFSAVGSAITVPAWDSGNRQKSSMTVDTVNGKVMVHWEAQKSGQYYEAFSTGTIGSTAVSYTAAALMNRWNSTQSTATQLKSMLTGAYDFTNKIIVTAATRTSDGSMKLQARRTTAVSLGSNYGDWVGIATAAINSGASGNVTVLGGVSTNQSGLTTGTTYYVDTDGTLTTTANKYPIGEALSATSIQLKGGVIVPPQISISGSAPSGANAGDVWWDSDNLKPYIYYNDGSSSQWVTFSAVGPQGPQGDSGAALVWAVKSANYTAAHADQLILTGSSALTITLPANPTVGHWVKVKNLSSATANIGRNGKNIDSAAQDGTIAANLVTELVYVNATIGWAEI